MPLSKAEMRHELIEKRKSMSANEKALRDKLLFTNVIRNKQFINAENVLIYVSTSIEADTLALIKYSLENKKNVYTPKCTDDKSMLFFKIDSLSQLKAGMYNILEPQTNIVFDGSSNSVCIVPALAFNVNGYRLGYGKGYYDRFLSNFKGFSIGICYKNYINEIPTDKYDFSVNIVITD